MAYELCTRSTQQTSNAATISALVLKCKKAKWDIRERDRIRRRKDLLAELEVKLEEDYKKQVYDVDERLSQGEIGEVAAQEERDELKKVWEQKVADLRTAFAISDPENMAKREVPEYLIDGITFEIMHDRTYTLFIPSSTQDQKKRRKKFHRKLELLTYPAVVTKTGQSYERATIIEHLKRNPTDPLTREPCTVAELRPNIALREACNEFYENNNGWIYDW